MTSPSPVCPFGPAACASSNDPEEMSTVLYTPECTICRGGVSQAGRARQLSWPKGLIASCLAKNGARNKES
ncbi:unnamed protein product [Durusdinium trenchii]|uniref:Uncharacterized protein n=1 Tax=Durusdinium trenchii TaxID=1381693 RepID=A0ABP0K6B6_9DINO